MLIRISKPYISDHPLGNRVTWVAFPILITVKDRTHSSALKSAREVLQEFMELGSNFEAQGITVPESPISDSSIPETEAEFVQSGKESLARIQSCVFTRFEDSVPLWDKLEFVSRSLDRIAQFVDEKRSVKNLKIETGPKELTK